MKNLYLFLLALAVASCSSAESSSTPHKPQSESDAIILGFNGPIKSVTQKVFKVEIDDDLSEKRTPDRGDILQNLLMSRTSAWYVHDLIYRKLHYTEYTEEYGDIYFADITEDCNYTLQYNANGDLTNYSFIIDEDETVRTECKYHNNGYIKEKKTYEIGESYENYGDEGFLEVASTYNDKGNVLEEVYYGGIYNPYTHQVDSSYVYSKLVVEYDDKDREIVSDWYEKNISSKRTKSEYSQDNKLKRIEEYYNEDGELTDTYVSNFKLDENGDIIKEESEIIVEECEITSDDYEIISVEEETSQPQSSKLSQGCRIYYDENNKRLYSEVVEHETKDVVKVDSHGNWTEKRTDYIYADGTKEYGEWVYVREIQYY